MKLHSDGHCHNSLGQIGLAIIRHTKYGRHPFTRMLGTTYLVRFVTIWLCNTRGGQKTKWKTPSPNFEELIESITNMLLFFAGGSRKKSYEVSKFGGGGGGSMP